MKRIENAEIVVALISRNNRDSIRHCAEIIGKGLRTCLNFLKPVVINFDCASNDGTIEEFQKADFHRTVEFFSIETKLRNNELYKALFDSAQRLEASFIVAVDAGVSSIEPRWLLQLAAPVMEEGYDMAAPRYYDPPFSHLFRDLFHVPLFASMYGLALSNPALEHFSFSGRHLDSLTKLLLSDEEKPVSLNPVLRAALINQWKVCESITGERKEEIEPQKRLEVDSFRHAAPFIESIKETSELWNREITPCVPPMYGEYRQRVVTGAPCNMETLWEAFRDTVKKQFTLLSRIFSRELFKEICSRSDAPWRHGGIPLDIWGEMVFQLLIASLRKKEVYQAMPALISGFVAGRAVEPASGSLSLLSENVERPETQSFLEKRDAFLERWNSER